MPSMDEPLCEPVEGSADDSVAPMEGVVEVQEAVKEEPQDDEMRGEYTWVIENVTRPEGMKEYSPKFEIGTHLWRLLIMLKGGPPQKEFMALYLDSPEAGFAPDQLLPRADFTLTLINQAGTAPDFKKESAHKWSKEETDWGFTQFMPVADVVDPARGWLVNDSLKVKVQVAVQRNERYTLDARKETGHVGLKNQGATCYMNSLLQYLYHLPYLRKAVYHMPTSENDEPSSSLPLALQSLFYKLQFSRTPVSTKDLTASFGWSSVDAFMQHDVQELNRVLCEKLEEKMKGTRVEKVINELFEGHTLNFLQCVDVDYKSSRRESFMDLQLDVKGCANVYESFDKYTEVEMMVGDNQYKAEGHGLQDARKGVLFDALPPVLQLQLKRFEYDFQRDAMVKINDRYEFYDELDLDRGDGKYLTDNADRSVRNLYKLHSVLVHSGGVHGGHYYAYIRPDGKTWLRFDDTAVAIEDAGKALDEQFGGEDEPPARAPLITVGNDAGAADGGTAAAAAAGAAAPPPPAKRPGGLKFAKFSNAYMLVYVRLADWPRVMLPVADADIAPYLRERLEAEQREKEKRQKEKQEAHLYCNVRIATDADIAGQVGSSQWFDLVDYSRLDPTRTFRVRKLTPFSEFKRQVEAELGVPVKDQRFWAWKRRHNKTIRPTHRLTPAEEEQTVLDLRDHRVVEERSALCKAALMDLRFYLEVDLPPGIKRQEWTRSMINLFFKFYDPTTESLRYVGHRYVDQSLAVRDLYPLLCHLAGLAPGTPLDVFEEVKWEPEVMVTPLPPNQQLGAEGLHKLENGDIICFQLALPPGAAAAAVERAAAAAANSAAAGDGSMEVEQLSLGDQQQQQQPSAAGQQQADLQSQVLAQQQAALQQQQQGGGEHANGNLAGCRFPCVVDFLCYIRDRRLVTFKRLEDPKEAGIQLELLKSNSYDAVTAALASKLGLADATTLRLTQHNSYSAAPQRVPMRFRGLESLERMLTHASHATDTLYYEVLDLPLPQLEQLKTLRIQFHNDKTEFVGEHVVRVPRDGTVADVLAELRPRLAPEYAERPLRLLEVYNSKIYKVADPAEEVAGWNENYWVIRVEPVPDDEQAPPAKGDLLIRVAHIAPPKPAPGSASGGSGGGGAESPAAAAAGANDAPAGAAAAAAAPGSNGGGWIGCAPAGPQQQAIAFGDPFLLRVGPQETVAEVRRRVQAKLGVAAREFKAWRAAFVSLRAGPAPQYLADDEPLAPHFSPSTAVASEADYLALEHEDAGGGKGGPRRPSGAAARHGYTERAIKIAS